MTGSRLLRAAPAALVAAALAGCGTVASLNTAARSLATYELNPVSAGGGAPVSGRGLFVDAPTAPPALATDRILIKPTALQVAYLPDGRWVDAAPAHVRLLLARSLADSGRLGFVTARSVGPLPEYVLLTDLEAFQAELGAAEGAATPVRIRMTLTILRDADQRIVAARRFERRATAADATAEAIVPALDLAMTALLRDATQWTVAAVSGGV